MGLSVIQIDDRGRTYFGFARATLFAGLGGAQTGVLRCAVEDARGWV